MWPQRVASTARGPQGGWEVRLALRARTTVWILSETPSPVVPAAPRSSAQSQGHSSFGGSVEMLNFLHPPTVLLTLQGPS